MVFLGQSIKRPWNYFIYYQSMFFDKYRYLKHEGQLVYILTDIGHITSPECYFKRLYLD
tara:strand:- start:164 stop:340 length:177 start_codon:yes stop_codon:yes gene_type:complete